MSTNNTRTAALPFYCYPSDNTHHFESRSFVRLEDAIAYGEGTGRVFAVALPSGALAAFKAREDGETAITGLLP